MPPPLTFPPDSEWYIGKPDLTVTTDQDFVMYPSGPDWWIDQFGEVRLTEDRWIKARSEEHTSELQSRQYLVCRLLLEKKEDTSQVQSLQHELCRIHLYRNYAYHANHAVYAHPHHETTPQVVVQAHQLATRQHASLFR